MLIRILVISVLILLVVVFLFQLEPQPTPKHIQPTNAPTPTINAELVEAPIAEFKSRITKKPFGIFITPKTSPVQPERFRGFHTGTDIEYGDVTTDVPVKAITNGQIIYSGYVNGYGGFIAEKINYQNQDLIIIYGHLRPSSLIKNNSKVNIGDTLGVLGTAYSQETTGERRHLHFAILKGTKLDFRGYVQSKSELNLWLDPLTLIP